VDLWILVYIRSGYGEVWELGIWGGAEGGDRDVVCGFAGVKRECGCVDLECGCG
jgi:hypothetical protein